MLMYKYVWSIYSLSIYLYIYADEYNIKKGKNHYLTGKTILKCAIIYSPYLISYFNNFTDLIFNMIYALHKIQTVP